jgi:hypothetical protein
LAVFIEFGVMETEAIGIFPEYYREINCKGRNTKTHYLVNMWSVFHVHVYVVGFQAMNFLMRHGITCFGMGIIKDSENILHPSLVYINFFSKGGGTVMLSFYFLAISVRGKWKLRWFTKNRNQISPRL